MKIEFIDQTNDKSSSAQGLSRDNLYGDGFFTTGVIKLGKILHWNYHQERLLSSAKRLCFKNFLLDVCRNSIEKLVVNVADAAFRISITRCQQKRGYAVSGSALSLCRLYLFPHRPVAQPTCQLVFANTPISVNPYFAGIKHLNRLDSVLAASEIKKNNQEALLCHGDLVVSGSRSNLFLFKKNQWHTPLLDQAGVNGITRLRVLKIMQERGIVCHESNISRNQFANAEAAFVCNSLMGIWPASKIQANSLDTTPSIELQQLLIKEGN